MDNAAAPYVDIIPDNAWVSHGDYLLVYITVDTQTVSYSVLRFYVGGVLLNAIGSDLNSSLHSYIFKIQDITSDKHVTVVVY